jgi:hypothetical protein
MNFSRLGMVMAALSVFSLTVVIFGQAGQQGAQPAGPGQGLRRHKTEPADSARGARAVAADEAEAAHRHRKNPLRTGLMERSG